MHQSIFTLNIPKNQLTNLQSSGTYYASKELLGKTNSEGPQLKTALDLLEQELTEQSILSFNSRLDEILIDEVIAGRIVEVAGPPGSGKTQICFQLSLTTQLPTDLGGLNGQVIYICTNKNFSPGRVRELAQKLLDQTSKLNSNQRLTCEDFLKNIYVFNISTSVELYASIKYLEFFLKDLKVKLVIIDSISNPLRDVEGAERIAYTYKLLNELQVASRTFGFAILITNDFTMKVKDKEIISAPSFGDSFLDRVNTRICLTKLPGSEIYSAELVKSPIKSHLTTNFLMF